MIRRFGEPPLNGQHYRLRPGAYAVLLARGRGAADVSGGAGAGVPVARRRHRSGRISLSPRCTAKCARRPAGRIAAPRRIGAFRRFAYMPEYDRWAEKLCTVYLARPVRRLGPPSETGHSAVWVGAGRAAGLVDNPGDRHFLRQALRLVQPAVSLAP